MSQKNYVVPNQEEAKAALVKFAHANRGMAYAFVTDHEGVLTVHERWQQPCYGEMRPYGKTHPDLLPEHQRKVGKPGDLHSPFPQKGHPIMAVLCMYQDPSTWSVVAREGLNDYLSFFVSEDSPWYNATQYAEVLEEEGIPKGVLYNDTAFHPTVLVESWMFLRSKFGANSFKFWKTLREEFPDAKSSELALFWYGCTSWDNFKTVSWAWQEYYLSSFLEVPRFLNSDPILDGPTFFDRGAYNRPDLHFVFGHGKESLTKKFFDNWGKTFNQVPFEQVKESFIAFQKSLA